MPNGKQVGPLEELLKKSDVGKRKEHWQEQLAKFEEQIIKFDTQPPTAQSAIPTVPLYEPKSWWDRLIVFLGGGIKYKNIWAPIPEAVGTTWQEAPPQQVERLKREMGQAVNDSARAQFMLEFYETLPIAIIGGEKTQPIESFEDYLAVTGTKADYLTQDDIAEVSQAIEEWSKRREAGELPEWLGVPPKAEEKVRKFLEEEPTPPVPVSIQIATIESILGALAATPPQAEIPEGLTEQDLFTYASIIDVPKDTLAEVLDVDVAMETIAAAQQEREQVLSDVMTGIDEWEVPESSFWDKAFFLVQSPMQQISSLIEPYLQHVSYPLAGYVQMMAKRILGDRDAYDDWDAAIASGMDPWHAAGEVWEEWSAPWYVKLPIEIFTDPITYIPGWGLSKPGALLVKLGAKRIGRSLIGLNKWIYKTADIPFDLWKTFQAERMARTFTQIINKQSDDFLMTLSVAVNKQTGKAFHQFTANDIADTLVAARKAFVENPQLLNDPYVALGEYLSRHMRLNGNQVYLWSRRHSGKLVESVDDVTVREVNGIIDDFIMKTLPPRENAVRMADALMIPRTPKNIAKLAKEIPTFGAKQATDIDTVIRIGKSSEIGPVQRMLNYMVTRQRAIAKSVTTGVADNGNRLQGLILGLQRNVDKIENMRIRQVLDRYVVKTFAEANLGSAAYPIWNVFEGVAVHLIEGVIPGFLKQEAYEMMVKGLLSDPGLAFRSVSEPAGMIGATGTRKAGAITLLPQGKLFGWLGRNWVDISNYTGNMLRRNFVARKMEHYLIERAMKASGGDVVEALGKLAKGSPKISKQTLGLNNHELEQELFRRLLSSDDDALALKGVLTNGSLMQGETQKILRKAELISPRARALGERLVQEGKALRTEADLLDFVKQVSDTAIEDLRKYPFEVADSFRDVANAIDSTVINTSDDLMEVFTHYEVMSETAAYIPHRIMRQTMEEADILRQAEKFGQVKTLWTKRGEEMLNAVDVADDALGKVKAKILANGDRLTDKQRMAMERVLDRSEASSMVRRTALDKDRQFMKDFWSLPRDQRTKEAWDEAWSYRDELWSTYELESAIPSAGEFVTRRNLAKLYHDIPEPRLSPVNAEGKALTSKDVADVLGVNIDGLVSGMLDNVSMHGKQYFVQLVKQSADAKPNLFRGFTEEKIAQVYDNILAQSRMRPGADIATEKLLAQMEGVKQDLINLKVRHSLTPDEEKALHTWIDNAVAGRKKIIGERAAITPDDWNKLRQEALNDANKDYYKSFADYTNETMVGGLMKNIYPYWTYHTYRWFYLSRSALRHPGLPVAWGKYNNYGENGYMPTWFPDIEMNPFVGSMMGTTFTLTRFDFASYYNQLGIAGEVLDYTQRIGFFPNALAMFPIALTPYLSGRSVELGEINPPIGRTGLNLLVASNIPAVSDSAKWLKDHVFHENFHEYYTATLLSNKQVESGGKILINPDTGEPQSGVDIWYKRLRKEPLTDEEQTLWDESYREAALYGLMRSQFPQFRLKTEEYKEAYKQVTKIFEEQLGMSESFQKELWRQHIRPTDVVGGLPLDLRLALDDLWQWKTMTGRGTILMPPDVQDTKSHIDDYWKSVKTFQAGRLTTQTDTDNGFLHIGDVRLRDRGEWVSEYAENWSNYISKVDGLKETKFKDIEELLSPEGQLAMAKRLGFNSIPRTPMDEAIDLYFSFELELKRDPYTGEEDWDFLGFWLKRSAVRMALTEEQREEFDSYIRRYSTPVEKVFRQVYNDYIRGYKAVNRIILQDFTDDEQKLIKEYFAKGTTRTRVEEIEDVVRTDGLKLISQYRAKGQQGRENMREASPKLDFYLYVFGYADKPKTEEAQNMVDAWEKDRTSILYIVPAQE